MTSNHKGHFLDLLDEFISECSHTKDKGHCRVMSLATYLASLHYDNEATAHEVAVTLAHAMLGSNRSKIFTTGIYLASRSLGAKLKGDEISQKLSDIPSLLLSAALFEGSSLSYKEKNIDPVELHCHGENKENFPVIQLSNPFIFESKQSIYRVVDKLNLGDEQDKHCYQTPSPLNEEILPGLCIGNGGLVPDHTPRSAAYNRVVAVLFNRLSANCYHILEGNFREDELFRVVYKVDGKPDQVILSPKELLMIVDPAHVNGGIKTNFSSFGASLCILDEDHQVDLSRSFTTDSAAREFYTQIPISPVARTGICDPETNQSIKNLAIHSSFQLVFHEQSILGGCRIQYYLGVEGFTGWHAGNSYHRAWVDPTFHDIPPLSFEELLQAVSVASAQAIGNNFLCRKAQFAAGGYGTLGVCADSAAVIQHAIRQENTIFPLMMQASNKALLLNEIKLLIKKLARRSVDDSNLPVRYIHARKTLQHDLQDVHRALHHLHSDIQIHPNLIDDALERIHCSCPGWPFEMGISTKRHIKQVRVGVFY